MQASLAGLTVNLDTNSLNIDGQFVHLRPQRAELLHVLIAAYPRTVPYDVIIGRLWGLTEPEHPLNTIKVVACACRKILEAHGYTLTGVKGRGLRIDVPGTDASITNVRAKWRANHGAQHAA